MIFLKQLYGPNKGRLFREDEYCVSQNNDYGFIVEIPEETKEAQKHRYIFVFMELSLI